MLRRRAKLPLRGKGVELGLPNEAQRVRARASPAEPPIGEAAPAVDWDPSGLEFRGESACDAIMGCSRRIIYRERGPGRGCQCVKEEPGAVAGRPWVSDSSRDAS